ncbi:MAG: AAA family ATPase [Acidobacteria bacterium]|nr:AAA family ATPase [Acidobacteriota bacterium]
MPIPVIAFFNNKGGVGKTSLVYHLAWMYAELGIDVLAVDLDPQANLTVALLDEDTIAGLWSETGDQRRTVFGSVVPLIEGFGDIKQAPPVLEVSEGLALLAGDLALSRFEDDLSQEWPHCLDRKPKAFRITSAFWRLIQAAGRESRAKVALMDLGPNLGSINRASLIACDHLVVPLAPDLFSLQGLRNLGPALREWKKGWSERLEKARDVVDFDLPPGRIEPAGYVVLQHAVRLDRPVKAYETWVARIPGAYRTEVLGEEDNGTTRFDDDPNCLALLKHYRSLMPLAQEARKPIFALKPADGALGSHFAAAQEARKSFHQLAVRIAERCLPSVLKPPGAVAS